MKPKTDLPVFPPPGYEEDRRTLLEALLEELQELDKEQIREIINLVRTLEK